MVSELELSTCIAQILCVTLLLECSAEDIFLPLPPPISDTDILVHASSSSEEKVKETSSGLINFYNLQVSTTFYRYFY